MASELTPFTENYEGQDDDLSPDCGHESLHKDFYDPSRTKSKGTRGKSVMLLLSIASNVCLSVALLLSHVPKGMPASKADNLQSANPIVSTNVAETRMVPMKWGFEYSAATVAEMDEVDRNWDRIDASLGLVSVDYELAAMNGLPPTTDDPRNSSKGVYIIEAYHSLHCLAIMRRTMFQLARGEKLDIPFGHSSHCFGSLLQAILCNADTTLMYQKPGFGPGDGQMRSCRNWPALRDWAKENSACMSTNVSGIASEDLDNCDKITAGDGVLLGDWSI